MAPRLNRIPFLALIGAALALLTVGCGKELTDEQFAAAATTLHANVKASWDHQPGEAWETYIERRVAEACIQNGASVRQWDKKMKDVQAHPEQYEKLLEPAALAEVIKWHGDRLRAKGQE